MLKGDFLHEHFLKLWYNDIFIFFLIHESKGVMILHHYEAEPLAPDFEHGSIYDISKGTLRIIRNPFSLCRWIITSSKEPSLSSSKCNKVSNPLELIVGPSVPTEMSGKRAKILWLESNDDWLWEVGLHGESGRLAYINRYE